MTSSSKIIFVLCLILIIGGTGAQMGECPYIDFAFVVGFPTSELDWNTLKTFITRTILGPMQFEYSEYYSFRAAMVTVGEIAKVEFRLDKYLNNSKHDVVSAVEGVPYSRVESTALGDALRLVREEVFVADNGDRPDAANVIIIVADGSYQSRSLSVDNEAVLLQEQDVRIIGVSVTDLVSDITEATRFGYFNVLNYTKLVENGPSIFKLACPLGAYCPLMNLAFVVGFPTSEDDWILLRNTMKDIVFRMHNVDEFAVVSFDDTAKIEFHFNKHQEIDIISAIDNIEYSRKVHKQAIDDALRLVRQRVFLQKNGTVSDISTVVILITDGYFRNDYALTSEIDLLKNSGVLVLPIGVNVYHQMHLDVVRRLAFNIAYAVSVDNYTELYYRMQNELAVICSLATPRDLEKCTHNIDLILILDESSSITESGYNNWKEHMLGFAAAVVNHFNIGRNRTRVAVVKFSSNATLSIGLDDYYNKADLTDAIGNLNHSGGATNIAAALRLARNEIIGNDVDRQRVIVLITDGEDTVEDQTLPREIELLKQTNSEIFAIGIADRIKKQRLRSIASGPVERHVFPVDSADGLHAINKNIFASCFFLKQYYN